MMTTAMLKMSDANLASQAVLIQAVEKLIASGQVFTRPECESIVSSFQEISALQRSIKDLMGDLIIAERGEYERRGILPNNGGEQ
ncbi:hypothetical protein [Halomonas sp. KHS3]|uniref:hypothetical protein n=1 Tax=Halomonas sp. KHS3 TaxID=866350 RepID=UPI001269BC57|nr:hypothetical protein [Halomonas sp. KHS3]